jgi:hypothetical protein
MGKKTTKCTLQTIVLLIQINMQLGPVYPFPETKPNTPPPPPPRREVENNAEVGHITNNLKLFLVHIEEFTP